MGFLLRAARSFLLGGYFMFKSFLKTIISLGCLLWSTKLQAQRWIMFITSMGVTLLVFIQVIMRYFFDVPLYGIEEIAIYLAVWSYFIGASYGAKQKEHISASLVDVLLPEGRGQDFIAMVVDLITAVVSAWMVVWSWHYLAWTFKRGTLSVDLGLHMGWVHSAIFIGLTLMTLYFSIDFVERLIHFIKYKKIDSGKGGTV
jgi:TRAP-type C4-dicarboxylate transport system permease small subunit